MVEDSGVGIEIPRRDSFRVLRGVRQQGIGQGLQPCLPGDHSLAPPFGFVGQVEVFKSVLGIGTEYCLLQLRAQLVLLGDTGQDGLPPVLHLPQVTQALVQRAHLGIIQGAGNFLAIAGDEGHGGALVQEFDGCVYLAGVYGELIRDALGNGLGHGLKVLRAG